MTLFNPLKPILAKGDSLGVTVVSKSQVSQFTALFNLIVTLKWVIPVVALVLGILAIVIAVDHRKTLVRVAVGVALVTLFLLAGLSLGRITFINKAGHSFNRDVAAAVWDTMLRFLKTDLRWALLVSVLVALGAWLAGPSRFAVWIRSTCAKGGRWVATQAHELTAERGAGRRRFGAGPAFGGLDPGAPERSAHLRRGGGRSVPRLRREPDRVEPPGDRHRAGRVPGPAATGRFLGAKGGGAGRQLRHGVGRRDQARSSPRPG